MRKNVGAVLRTAAVATAGAAAALVLPIAPATAAETDESVPEARSQLVLTMSASTLAPGSRFTLECQPPGGDHPDPVTACATLSQAGGDFNKIDPNGMMGCHALHDPVTVTAEGTWLGEKVTYSRSFTNGCAAMVATNFVFMP
ncbi:SSI family serine proteinase inhibitor [Streptomyces sp. TRM 70361]|uniref:SSI family serine proteinase inhibitor n=1 Tax=Streptomyces sp. TRM 70361 TaxID=3116553 RepID=UPI002E7C30B0|nr:SSI family serine proteinase inhibitor [Streptomyces sp. TRM 70361]MEE1938216.1 SSI family serine proteinase inhibitor [Streptomyces sp. TRM 70361]